MTFPRAADILPADNGLLGDVSASAAALIFLGGDTEGCFKPLDPAVGSFTVFVSFCDLDFASATMLLLFDRSVDESTEPRLLLPLLPGGVLNTAPDLANNACARASPRFGLKVPLGFLKGVPGEGLPLPDDRGRDGLLRACIGRPLCVPLRVLVASAGSNT